MVRRLLGVHHQPGRHRGVQGPRHGPPRPLTDDDHPGIAARLRAGGVLDPDADAAALVAHAAGDDAALEDLVARRLAGVPLARLVGRVRFAGLDLAVADGVYLPRWTTEVVAEAAAAALPRRGVAVDLCTGTGAVAAVLSHRRPGATVLATDLSPAAVECARRNGVDARQGDLDAPLPAELAGRVDVVVAVPPFVPTTALDDLHPDVRHHEPVAALDGGERGLALARRIVDAAPRWLREHGWILVQVGPDQVPALADLIERESEHWDDVEVIDDLDGDPCAVGARRG